MEYSGWELEFFDTAKNYRKYQYNLLKNFIKKTILEVGPGNATLMERYIYKNDLDIVLAEINNDLFEKINNKFNTKDNIKVYNVKTQSGYITVIQIVMHILIRTISFAYLKML